MLALLGFTLCRCDGPYRALEPMTSKLCSINTENIWLSNAGLFFALDLFWILLSGRQILVIQIKKKKKLLVFLSFGIAAMLVFNTPFTGRYSN